MAINKKLIHFLKKENFENEVANGNILDNSIVFIKDTKEIWTHGTYYGSDAEILDNKVDKIEGKGLSTNDFTDSYKTQLDDTPFVKGVGADSAVSNSNYGCAATGANSFATGIYAKAKGQGSIALGRYCEASGRSSVSLGGFLTNIKLTGEANSLSYKVNSKVEFYTKNPEVLIGLSIISSVTDGTNTELATITGSVLLETGELQITTDKTLSSKSINSATYYISAAKAIGNTAVSIGSAWKAAGDYSVVLGRSAALGKYSTAIGQGNLAKGESSVAMGASSLAEGNYSAVFGLYNNSTGHTSFTTGQYNTASGTSSTAIGGYSVAEGNTSTAIGGYCSASNTMAVAIGQRNTASGKTSFSTGFFTTASGDYSYSEGGSLWNVYLSGDGTDNSYQITKGSNWQFVEDLEKLPGSKLYNNTTQELSAIIDSYTLGEDGYTITVVLDRSIGTLEPDSRFVIPLGKAEGECSHSQNGGTKAVGNFSTSSGAMTIAEGTASSAFGDRTISRGNSSATFGEHTFTTNTGEFALGISNISHTGETEDSQTLLSVGIGESSELDLATRIENRIPFTSMQDGKNALEIMRNGDIWFGEYMSGHKIWDGITNQLNIPNADKYFKFDEIIIDENGAGDYYKYNNDGYLNYYESSDSIYLGLSYLQKGAWVYTSETQAGIDLIPDESGNRAILLRYDDVPYLKIFGNDDKASILTDEYLTFGDCVRLDISTRKRRVNLDVNNLQFIENDGTITTSVSFDEIKAPKFVTQDGTADQVVLGDGTLKNISDFNTFDPSILDSKQDKIEDILTLSAAGNTSNNTINVKTTTDDGSASNIEILYNDLSDGSTIQQQMNISSAGINSYWLMNYDNSLVKANVSKNFGIFAQDASNNMKLSLNYEDETEIITYDIKQSHYSNAEILVSKDSCYTHFVGNLDDGISSEAILGITSGMVSILELKRYSLHIKACVNAGNPYIEIYSRFDGTTTITPTDITSPKFIKTNGTATQILMADGSVKEISEVGKSYSTATESEDGLMSKATAEAFSNEAITYIYDTNANVTSNGNGVNVHWNMYADSINYLTSELNTENELGYVDFTIPLATTTTAGVMSAEDKSKLDSLSTSTDGGMTISGTVNLTNGTFNTQNNSSLNSYTKVFNNMSVGEMRMYLVADSSGNLPSTETAVTVPYDGILSPAQVYFGKSQAFGVSVGDICVLFKKSSILNICRIIPLNDVKPSNGDFPGADGLVTVWDKNRINKIDGIEWTANHVRDTYLPKSDRYPSRSGWLLNVNECLEAGVYPTCDVYSSGLTELWLTNDYFTCIVVRTSTEDNGGYHTIEQTAHGRGADEGKIFKRIIFYKSDGSDTQYGKWINIVSSNAFYSTCKYGSDSMINFIRSIKYSLINRSNILDGTIHFHDVDDYVGVVSFFKYGDQKCKVIGQTIGSLSHNSIYETGILNYQYSGFCGTLTLQDDNICNSDCLCATTNEDTWKFNGRVN